MHSGGFRSCSSMVICEPKGGCEQICCSENERTLTLARVTRTPECTIRAESYFL
ncbi:MAG: hypothetical protein JWO84_391 [Parcubacteria group bacterium]|nr:hypothetical protein [Parcubacteria group bacterium]